MFKRRKKKIADEDRTVSDIARSRERTMNRAVRLLAAKPRSISELRERLLEKSWTNHEVVDGVVGKLEEYKYLDDEQYARDLAVSKLRQRPQGKRRLKQSLSQKKLDKETVDRAMAAAFEKIPEVELIDQAIEKRIKLKGKPTSRDEMKKFCDHLLRRGFGYDLVISRMRDVGKFESDE